MITPMYVYDELQILGIITDFRLIYVAAMS